MAAAVVAAGAAAPQALAAARTEVVVTLDPPPLARAVADSRALSARSRARRLELESPTSRAYLADLSARQAAVVARIRRAIPSARVRWRYRVVLDGLAVVVPTSQVGRLDRIAGVADVVASVAYRPRLDRSGPLIGAPALWGPSFATVGTGIKIGIVDTGVDQTHPFFAPNGYTMPPGFPKGNKRYTTAKVIVARVFPPPKPRPREASLPAPIDSHATHVAGIAAGDRGTLATGGRHLSGVAPGAYIGNYRVLTYPTASGVGPDGNSPEIVSGIEAAVRDGMDVINLSLGEPEIEPTRDLVVRAINAAAQAGVVPTIAAGNEFAEFGHGSIGSPGSAARAITVAATSKSVAIASFSSAGPTPVSLAMKPDVSAPGENILSSVLRRDSDRLWDAFSGTSMAAPHVAGAAALLRQRHPSWTVAQIKSALVLTGTPVADGGREAPPTREGGGLVELERADAPLIFAAPTGLSFGLVRSGETVSARLELTDAGGGGGAWTVAVNRQPGGGAATFAAPSSIDVPGTVRVSVTAGATEGDVTGFVVLARGGETRRVPFWFRVADPKLRRERRTRLARPGTYRATTSGRPALVDRYRYPEDPSGVVTAVLAGPERVFRVSLRRAATNFGVRLVSEGPGVQVEPRIVFAGNENRLTGFAALPYVLNPYLAAFQKPVAAAGVTRPKAGAYDVVFDSATPARAGRFRFRFWVGDTSPPRVKLARRTVPRGQPVRLRVTDRGSGVWPASIRALIDGRGVRARYSSGRATIATGDLARGRHRLVFVVSDYQETRNDENVAAILPNTRRFTTAFRVR